MVSRAIGPSRAVYNLPLAWRCTGDLNVSALERSLVTWYGATKSRTTFPAVNGQPVQVIAPELDLPLSVVDPSTASD